ncbi:glucuronyl esterase domain-containing protein [Neolewinella xylanilytica]|uniref:glucuronyl esterase domain-containing protein n=1 Tax=Neolewinella xylanilytica TaxID=1514080 RepID=UPI0011B03ACA|nr:acetylxylan esterase [Neolewinella xylanilytica]
MHVLYLTALLLTGRMVFAQTDTVAGIPVNYDETRVPAYALPDPLILQNGEPVTNSVAWYERRRPEILRLFETEQFGRAPERGKPTFTVFESATPAYNGTAVRRQVTIYFTPDTSRHKADLLIYTPANARVPVPLFLKIGFSANSLSFDDPGIREGTIWTREGKRVPASEGRSFGTMDVAPFLSAGIGVAAIYYGDIEPDFQEGIPYGVRGHYLAADQAYPADYEWGTIAAWAWGMSGVMDYLETDERVDADKVAVFGASRLGKTALWAGARDQRFGMVIACCSGEGGAALSRRQYGETTAHMIDSTRYDYQFAGNRRQYGADPNTSPVDAHMLLSLIAPRPLLLQTGTTDNWSDPRGEFEAAVAAEPVYELLGKRGLATTEWPGAGEPVLHDLGYLMHEGGHGTLPEDYPVFIEFMKQHFLD